MEKLLEWLEKVWLRRRSIPLVAIITVVAYIVLISFIADWEWLEIGIMECAWIAVAFIGFWGCYTVVCIAKDRLPKAPGKKLAVLFVIDAESKLLFEAAKFKLVDNFARLTSGDDGTGFDALCIPRNSIAKYNLRNKADGLKLLRRTNCRFLVLVRYVADDASNAESFELNVDYGVRHPSFNEEGERILALDMNALNAPVGKQRFVKADLIDAFDFTSQTVVIACRYILGVTYLLAGEYQNARMLLAQVCNDLSKERMHIPDVQRLRRLANDRYYVALAQTAREHLSAFTREHKDEHLKNALEYLELSNTVYKDTYFYNINRAYICIALEKDLSAAKCCIDRCKQSKEKEDWIYSEAFLAAYAGQAPGSVISKYQKALNVRYPDIVNIVDYIEYVLEQEPEKTTLHLAAGLVYEAIGDGVLMKRHLALFMEKHPKVDKRTTATINAKMRSANCNVNCNNECSACVKVVA